MGEHTYKGVFPQVPFRGRHGEPAAEQGEKKRDLVLREAEARHGCRGKKKLGLAKEEEAAMLHNEFDEHKREEGALSNAKSWASSWGSFLKERMARAALARRQRRDG